MIVTQEQRMDYLTNLTYRFIESRGKDNLFAINKYKEIWDTQYESMINSQGLDEINDAILAIKDVLFLENIDYSDIKE